MTVTILAPGVFSPLTSDEPEVGRRYILEPDEDGTNRQNRAFHALISEYWRSGAHSYPAKSFDEFRNMIKRHLGAGFEAFIYVDPSNPEPVINDAKALTDIPPHIPRDLIRGRLRSWSDYSKKQRIETIDRLIAEMHEAGVNTKRFQEILEGMQA
jgi:hypothetical protein